jgi:nitrite reductase/ring-hydroxylating ferredoxin subunit
MAEIELGALSDFADIDYRILAVGKLEIGVFRRGKKLVAYENDCPHFGGPVCQGKVIPRVEEVINPDKTSNGLRFSKKLNVICPWHGYEFDLDTGCHPADPTVRLKAIELDIRDNRVFARLPG